MQLEMYRQPGWTYRKLDARQREIAARVRAGGDGALLVSEVEPVITLGRRTQPEDLLLGREEFARRGIDVYEIDRGGLATYHGPGQWVIFAVESLERLTGDRRGVRRAVEGLLEAARRVASRHGSGVEIREGMETGVWTPRGKIASVGVHVEDGVLLHGLALNAFRTESSFLGIRPCGLDACAAFLWEKQPPELDFLKLAGELISAVGEVFSVSTSIDAAQQSELFEPPLDPSTRDSYKNFSSRIP